MTLTLPPIIPLGAEVPLYGVVKAVGNLGGERLYGFDNGKNIDRVNVSAGMRELAACDYDDPRTQMVVEYALARWARGEEAAAERGAIDSKFHGISLTCWKRVLAAAMTQA